MPLPVQIKSGLYINGLGGLLSGSSTSPGGHEHSLITGPNVTRNEVWYNGRFLHAGTGNRTPALQLSNNNPRNFLFVKDIQNKVAVGIAPKRPLDIHAYSDNYGGCEWHILSKNNGESVAFLHVYRGGGQCVKYYLSEGWEKRGTLESSKVMPRKKMGESIVSYSYWSSGSNYVDSCFILLDQQGKISDILEYKHINIGIERRPKSPNQLMPLSYEQWMQKTNLKGHWRSTDLKNVDKAIELCDQQSSSIHLQKLKTVFNLWYQRNPKERTIRNIDNCITKYKTFVDTV